MIEVKYNEIGQKIAVFKNVDSGEVIEKDFQGAAINPPSKVGDFIAKSGLGDANGGIDVNKYTLQHKKYENIFGYGDAVGFDTTRTQTAAQHQTPIVKNNVINFMKGKEINGVYNGYTYLPLMLGNQAACAFQHNHDFEPTARNDMFPHHGIFARHYYGHMMRRQYKIASAYGSFEKNHGPPYKHFSPVYDELEHNDYLKSKGVDWTDLVHKKEEASPAVAN